MPKMKPLVGKVKHDLELGACIELPLSAIITNYGGYKVLNPQPVYQCPICFIVLAHKFDGVKRYIRIQLCKKHAKECLDDNLAEQLS